MDPRDKSEGDFLFNMSPEGDFLFNMLSEGGFFLMCWQGVTL